MTGFQTVRRLLSDRKEAIYNRIPQETNDQNREYFEKELKKILEAEDALSDIEHRLENLERLLENVMRKGALEMSLPESKPREEVEQELWGDRDEVTVTLRDVIARCRNLNKAEFFMQSIADIAKVVSTDGKGDFGSFDIE